MSLKNSQAGLTLTELMVGIAISAFLSLVAATAYVGTTRLSSESTGMAARESQFAMVSEMITSNIRRAGYRGGVSEATAHWLNTTGGTDGSKPAVTLSSDGSCVITSAAVESGGSYTVQQFGVKLTGNVIQALSGDTVACDAGDWVAITDVNSQYFHILNVELVDETILNGDTGAEIEVSADEALTSWQKANCGTATGSGNDSSASSEDGNGNGNGNSGNSNSNGNNGNNGNGNNGNGNSDSESSSSEEAGDGEAAGASSSADDGVGGAVSCRIKQLYRVTLCANDESTADSCDNSEAYYAQWLVAPRNDVVISKAYSASEVGGEDESSSSESPASEESSTDDPSEDNNNDDNGDEDDDTDDDDSSS